MKNTSAIKLKFWYFIVSMLPNKLKYFCFMHVLAYATTGKYGATVVPDLTAMDAISRFEKDH